MTIDYKALAAQAAQIEDQTETTEGGSSEYAPPAAGVTIGRLIEYIEFGKQPQRPYQGTAKPDAFTARFTFELLAAKNIREVEIEGVKTKIADKISIEVTKSLNEKAKYKKIFNALQYGRTGITHVAQCLGEAFVLTVVHNEVEKDGKKRVYANLSKDGAWLIQPPVVTDPIAGTSQAVPVPEALSPLRIFLWDLANKETWDSLYIDGTRTVKDAKGVETQVSKNWIQDKILAATNFSGSPLEEVLTGADKVTEVIQSAQTTVVKKAGVTPKVAAAKSAKAAAPVQDPLAALGLV